MLIKIIPTSMRAFKKGDVICTYPSKFTVIGETKECVESALQKLVEIKEIEQVRPVEYGIAFGDKCYKAVVKIGTGNIEGLADNIVRIIKDEEYTLVIEQSLLEEDTTCWIKEDAMQLVEQAKDTEIETKILVTCSREIGIYYTTLCEEVEAHYEIGSIKNEVDCPIDIVV